MAAGGDQDGNIRIGISLPNLAQHGRQDNLTGHRTGMVAGNQDDPVLSLCQFPQGDPTLWGCHGSLHQFLPGQFWIISFNPGSQYIDFFKIVI